MVFGLYFFWTNDALYYSLFVENKGCAESTHVFASVHAFLTPHTKFFNQFLVSIGNKCEWQLVFSMNFWCDFSLSTLTPITS